MPVHIRSRVLVALALLGGCAALAIAVPSAATEAAAAKPKLKKYRHVGTIDAQPDSTVAFTVVKRGRRLVRVENVRLQMTLACEDGSPDVIVPQPYSKTFGTTRIRRAENITGFGWPPTSMRRPGIEGGYEALVGMLKNGGRRAEGEVETRYWTDPDVNYFCTIQGSSPETRWYASWHTTAR